jgi:hypothetical protein
LEYFLSNNSLCWCCVHTIPSVQIYTIRLHINSILKDLRFCSFKTDAMWRQKSGKDELLLRNNHLFGKVPSVQ